MKREYLNEYLGAKVTITFFDGDVITGILKFCDSFCREHGYRKPGYYYIDNLDFKCSHVKKIRRW